MGRNFMAMGKCVSHGPNQLKTTALKHYILIVLMKRLILYWYIHMLVCVCVCVCVRACACPRSMYCTPQQMLHCFRSNIFNSKVQLIK